MMALKGAVLIIIMVFAVNVAAEDSANKTDTNVKTENVVTSAGNDKNVSVSTNNNPTTAKPISAGTQALLDLFPLVKQPTPTIVEVRPFRPRIDAEKLNIAIKNHEKQGNVFITSVVAFRTNKQRREIADAFQKSFSNYFKNFMISLLSGPFLALVLAAMKPLPELYATELQNAMNNHPDTEEILVEILCTRTNVPLADINEAYKKLYYRNLGVAIKGATSEGFQAFLLAVIQGSRDREQKVDVEKAKQQAQFLMGGGPGSFHDNEEAFVTVLASQSFPQLRQVMTEYEQMTGTFFEDALKREFSGNSLRGMQAFVKSVRKSADFFAERFYACFVGKIDDNSLIRLVVSRSEIDLGDIKEAFFAMYDKTLAAYVHTIPAGDYKRMLLTMISDQNNPSDLFLALTYRP